MNVEESLIVKVSFQVVEKWNLIQNILNTPQFALGIQTWFRCEMAREDELFN